MERFHRYGVPAVCEHPGCSEEIDRGVTYACGDASLGVGCGLFFCDEHLFMAGLNEEGAIVNWLEGERTVQLCDRCLNGEEPYPTKPDIPEWRHHQATDPSWAHWRDLQSVCRLRKTIATPRLD